jgi:cytochrome c
MSISTTEAAFVLALATSVCGTAIAQPGVPALGFGTTPTRDELARFTSVLPDGRGLPPGRGSVAEGRKEYAEHCESCHGADLQGGIGDRLVGGRGTLVGNSPDKPPVKTVESYWPYATTLFDYIKRAMPLTSPNSLSNDTVYALCAYILARSRIVADDAVLDAASLAQVRMPNRDGFMPDPRPEKFPPAIPIAKSIGQASTK